MYGYVYITENLLNGKKYIGQHRAKNTDDDRYLGSGIALKKAIRKYGVSNFSREIISVANTREELDVLENSIIAEYDAVADTQVYNIAAGGGGCHRRISVEQLAAHAAKVKFRWQNMPPEHRAAISERIKASRTPEYRARMSATKMGISNWTPEAIASMVQKRKAQIANGIGVPPQGNRGNTEFRHTAEGKVAIRLGVAKARERIFSERDTYHTDEGMISMRERLAEHYTPEVRESHSSLVREGQARRLAEYEAKDIAPPKFHWYHNPSNPKERGSFFEDEAIPEGWVAGKGKTGPSKIDLPRVLELIAAGCRNADIAREVGCAPSHVWQIRHDHETK